MDHADSGMEAWLEQQVVRFRELGAASPEEFVEQLDPPAPDAAAARRLHERLCGLRRIEGALGPEPAEELAAGFELDDFVIEAPLGRGGMGQVFRARQRSLGRAVAIKVPLWVARLDARERERFRREAQAIAALRHPAIVALHQVGEHQGAPYLVMELAEGVPLAERLRALRAGELERSAAALDSDEPTYERAVARLAIGLLEGLEAAHAEGVVHRDLKPANVMLAPDGRARILDFGLARRALEDSLTRSGELVGTPEYLAPELVQNPRTASPASDVYACGVLLYELLCFERPFASESTQVLLARILAGDPPPLATRARVPRALSAIVEKAMARDPLRRYASAADCAADLYAWLEGREVGARSSGPLTRLGRRLQRRPALTAVSVLALLAAAGLVSFRQQYSVVQAGVDQDRARKLFVQALLDEHLDSDSEGEDRTRTEGREGALRKLERALELAPDLLEAEVHRCVLLAELGRIAEFRARRAQLGSRSADSPALEWIEANLERGEGGFVAPVGSIGEGWEELPAGTRFYIARALHTRPGKQGFSAEVARTLRNDALYGAPARVLESIAITIGGGNDFESAARLLEAALLLAPGHPVLVANQGRALLELWQAELARSPWRQPDPGALPLGLRDCLERFEETRPRVPRSFAGFWVNYAGVLGTTGLQDVLVTEFTPLLEDFPESDSLLRNWLAAVVELVLEGGPVAPEALDQAAERVESWLAGNEGHPDFRVFQLLAAGVWRGLEQPEAVRAYLDALGQPPPMAEEAFRILREWERAQER